jgi:hypothetical protein
VRKALFHFTSASLLSVRLASSLEASGGGQTNHSFKAQSLVVRTEKGLLFLVGQFQGEGHAWRGSMDRGPGTLED